jgi:hypothetical protein
MSYLTNGFRWWNTTRPRHWRPKNVLSFGLQSVRTMTAMTGTAMVAAGHRCNVVFIVSFEITRQRTHPTSPTRKRHRTTVFALDCWAFLCRRIHRSQYPICGNLKTDSFHGHSHNGRSPALHGRLWTTIHHHKTMWPTPDLGPTLSWQSDNDSSGGSHVFRTAEAWPVGLQLEGKDIWVSLHTDTSTTRHLEIGICVGWACGTTWPTRKPHGDCRLTAHMPAHSYTYSIHPVENQNYQQHASVDYKTSALPSVYIYI